LKSLRNFEFFDLNIFAIKYSCPETHTSHLKTFNIFDLIRAIFCYRLFRIDKIDIVQFKLIYSSLLSFTITATWEMYYFVKIINPYHALLSHVDMIIVGLDQAFDTLSCMSETPVIIVQRHKPLNKVSSITYKLIIPLMRLFIK
jgi:hypothetical protein